MRPQKIIVNTKGGLMAAIECAKDYFGPTDIQLNRKSGITIYHLEPHIRDTKQPDGWYIRGLNTMRRRIRKIKAKELLY